MGKYAEKAVTLFKEGFNCSQSVFGAFAEDYNLDQDLAMRIAASFGGGMGRMREVCGAVSGMLLVAGLETGAVVGSDREKKAENYAEVQALAEQFRAQNGSIICRELLGLDKAGGSETGGSETGDSETGGSETGGSGMSHVPEERTEAYYRKRPCAELVKCAAEILEKRYK
ncbi:MAG: C_GCAxxG_C_C family protein [Eubacterium sp.]|nr:C_GCAxxG_C_C family protein [Eubacterium sp.]